MQINRITFIGGEEEEVDKRAGDDSNNSMTLLLVWKLDSSDSKGSTEDIGEPSIKLSF